MRSSLKPGLASTILNTSGDKKLKLNPALTKLRKLLEKKPEPGEAHAEATEVLNLLAGILACSVPGALMESSTGSGEKKAVEQEAFTKALLACAEESIRLANSCHDF